MIHSKRFIKSAAALAVILLTIFACSVFNSPAPTLVPTIPADSQPTSTLPVDATSGTGAEQTDVPVSPPDQTISNTPPANLDSMFAPFWQTWTLLHRYFVDQPIDDTALAQGATDGILATVEVSETEVSDETAVVFAEAAGTPADLQEIFVPFWKTWIQAGTKADVQLMQTSLSAMIDVLGDQHTSYMDPDQFIQANIPIDGTYEGIGAWVDPNDEYLTIVSPMPDSPAEAAGLKPGDQIIKIDGDDMTGVDGNLVIRRVLGPAGSDVVLTVRREGVEDFDVVITRAQITIPSVSGEILEGTNIAYVQLFTFGDTTRDDLRNLLEELLAQNPDGLIFDLRNNGGGLLTTAIEVASEFIGDGVIMYEVYGDGSRDVYNAIPGGLATQIPLVVLINGGSASASEIVAGAIQDYGRAPLVGETSFGKGSVQNWLPLNDNGAVRITIARWFTPNERLIHEIGLTPEFPVELTEEDFTAGLDPQLDKAIALLTQD